MKEHLENEEEMLEGICKNCEKKIYIYPEHYVKDDNYCWDCLDKLGLD